MPLRLETITTDKYDSSITITTIKGSANGFTVGPAEAMNILGTSRSTLFRNDPENLSRTHSTIFKEGERVYSDVDLLLLSTKIGSAIINEDALTGLVELRSKNSRALLNIDWEAAQLLLDANLPKP